jgi:hypothetical protein
MLTLVRDELRALPVCLPVIWEGMEEGTQHIVHETLTMQGTEAASSDNRQGKIHKSSSNLQQYFNMIMLPHTRNLMFVFSLFQGLD